ncbi:hypothetical protein BHE90_003000 [Fusarium euwallaceae]|uniref:Heterokaryon incompatibility domain-containing protein n=2 Tax=Fusarium solani species complex TaxID=232080 RepID=A0A3M2SEW2_9HYPO|nr:hypothetical protein CDV36_004226 [Fusarium kuroshium]RTE82453.1 hypothetical protein BHE90_003000 [Fusarium euwallaceae]
MALYEPLDAARDEIRVISISGMRKDSEGLLQCIMETVSLSDRIIGYQESRDRSDDGSRPSTSGYTDSAESGQSGTKRPALGIDTQPRFSWGEYETLSYAWGSPSDPLHDILVNGQRYRVRQNLYDVLSQFRTSLRYASRVRLWVDAICINQDDGLERATQVKRMKQIYSIAMRTIVWLGKDLGPTYSAVIDTAAYVDQLSGILTRTAELTPDSFDDWSTDYESSEDTQSTFSSMDEEMVRSESSQDEPLTSAGYEETSESGSSEDEWSTSSSEDEETRRQRELIAKDQECLIEQLCLSRGFHDVPFPEVASSHRIQIYLLLILQPIIDNEYWRRVWIIQELSASARGSLILIGSSAFSLDELLGVAEHLLSSVVSMANMIPHLYASQPLYLNTFNFMSLIRSVNGIAAEQEGWHWMLQGLISKSTLAEDKFYGTVGLLNSQELSEMIIDYNRPVSQVSMDATRAIMKETNCLCQFVICTSVENPTLPSWALDLSQEYDRFTSLDYDFHLVFKGTDLEIDSHLMDRPRQSFSGRVVDDRTLIIRGSVLDEVDGLGSFPEDLLPPIPPGRTRKRIAPMSNPTTKTHAYGDALEMLKTLDKILLSIRPKRNRSVFHMPMLAVTEDEPYKPASYPEGMAHHTASKLLVLKHFCERNADFDLWGVKFGSLFPGLKEEERERVSASQKLAYQALSSLQPSYHNACNTWDAGILSRRRLISTIGGYLGLATPFAVSGDKICVVEGCHSLVLLRPVDEFFQLVGLLGIDDLDEEAERCRDGGFDRELMLR